MVHSIGITLLTTFFLISIFIFTFGCPNQTNGDRIEADFISNVYSKIESVKSYKLDGYYSGNDVNLDSFRYTILTINDTLNIQMNYKLYEELIE